MMTLLQYYGLWNIAEGTEPNPKSTSIVAFLAPTQAAIDF